MSFEYSKIVAIDEIIKLAFARGYEIEISVAEDILNQWLKGVEEIVAIGAETRKPITTQNDSSISLEQI